MTKVNITPKELQSLEEILSYLIDEADNLEEFKAEGGKYRDHIQSHIDKMWRFVGKVKEVSDEIPVV